MNAISEAINLIPDTLINFLLVTLFSLLIGLEQRRHYIKEQLDSRFGTDRTFTLIGILGFILYVISPGDWIPFLGGGLALALILSVYYFQRIRDNKQMGITSIVTAFITYCLTPLLYTQPHWMVLLIIVAVLVLVEIKESLLEFSKKFDSNEFITLAKFLVIAGVILPLLPDKPISDEFNITPYNFWLAIVAVSGISYISYLIKKFIFPEAGIVLTGILGGLYSSTATTFILAKKSKEEPGNGEVGAAIILATTMMYVRIFLLAFFFNKEIAMKLVPSFLIFITASVLTALFFLRRNKLKGSDAAVPAVSTHTNPLEFKTSLIFALLFIFFAVVTHYVSVTYGKGGISILSFIVGVTDIDPFILNLFQSKWNLDISILVMAVINAITSNNVLKMIYGIGLGSKAIRYQLVAGFGLLIALGLITSFIFQF